MFHTKKVTRSLYALEIGLKIKNFIPVFFDVRITAHSAFIKYITRAIPKVICVPDFARKKLNTPENKNPPHFEWSEQ